MTLLEALRTALALRRLRRRGRQIVLYTSHCGGPGWVATVDGAPCWAPSAHLALTYHEGEDTMSLQEMISQAAAAGVERVDVEAEGWVERGLDEARRGLARVELAPTVRTIAGAVLDELDGVRPELARVGADRVRDVLGRLYEGDIRAARGALSPSLEERLAAQYAATAAALEERRQREADAEALWAAVMRAGAAALKVAAPVLLASLGAPAWVGEVGGLSEG